MSSASEIVPERQNPEADGTAEFRYQQGIESLAAGRPEDAVIAFRQAIAADSGHVEAYHGLIRALRDAGDAESAVATALALTALTPDDPLAHTSLSIALQQAGRISEAEAAAGRARILEWKQQLATGPDLEAGADGGSLV